MRRPDRDRRPLRSRDIEDERQALITKYAAAEVTTQLKALVANDPVRAIRNLQRHEIEGIAVAAVVGYLRARDLVEFAEDIAVDAGPAPGFI